MTNKYRSLYTKSTSLPEETLTVLVAKVDVLDDTPIEAEIRTFVQQLKSPRAPRPSKLTAAHLKEWLRDAEEAERLERPIPEEWMTLCRAVTHIWETGAIPQDMAWGTLILLPKAVEGQFCGMGLLEIV